MTLRHSDMVIEFGTLMRAIDINLDELLYVIYACFALHSSCQLNNGRIHLEKTNLSFLSIMTEIPSQLFSLVTLGMIVMRRMERESEGHALTRYFDP